jgi:hypothetical protein
MLAKVIPGLKVKKAMINNTILHVTLPESTNVELAMAKLKTVKAVRFSELNGRVGIQPAQPGGAGIGIGQPRPRSSNGRFPDHWGAPPRIQTRDLRALPGGYGRGSSTLARWIQKNMDLDKANPSRTKGKKEPKGNVLPKKISLKDAQGGFAGFTGWVTTINTDGTWDRRQFFNQQLRPIEMQGRLTDAQAKAILATITNTQIEKLPARLGKFHGANPHVLTLTYGEKQIVLNLPPGAKLPKPLPGGKLIDTDAFALVAQKLMNLLKNDSGPKFPPGTAGRPALTPRR